MPFLKKEKADVVCLQELLEEDFELYKKELEMDGVHQVAGYVTDSVHIESRGKKHGPAIFAKSIINSGHSFYLGSLIKIEESFDKYLKNENNFENRTLVWVDVNNNNEIFRIATSHLPITHHGEVTSHQLETNDKLLEQLKTLGDLVFCGDTNAPRGRESYSRIAREFKDNIPEEYTTSLDRNIHRAKGVDFMVDCLFTTPLYIASNVKLKSGVSDHMAIVSEINKIY
jgi:endonuclease/exonuclease/phosphatase family metal-dependent hydrolase